MNTNLIINLPIEVNYIIKVLNENKYEAYIVGGCVRDSILGKEPKDWDITTNASSEEIKRLFSKTIDTGIKHGTITAVVNNQNFEITTFRTDGEYLDNRRPETVQFTSSLKDDLSRRDFTINAIAYHPEKGFSDPFDGIDDIRKGSIHAIGNPDLRFKEDALRMLRAIRFSAQLNFIIAQPTLQSIKNNSFLINNISHERVRDELTKLLVSESPLKFLLLKDTDILKHILPEFDACYNIIQNNPHHIYNVALHSINSVSFIENDENLRWAMLLHDIGKASTRTTDIYGIDHFYGHPAISEEMAELLLRRLKFDNKDINLICRLIRHHDRIIEPNSRAIRKAVSSIGDDIFLHLLKVKTADKKAQNPEFFLEINKIKEIEAIYYDIKEKQQCMSLKDLKIHGNDLMTLGFKQGKEIGIALHKLLDAVINNPDLNEKDKLINFLKHIK